MENKELYENLLNKLCTLKEGGCEGSWMSMGDPSPIRHQTTKFYNELVEKLGYEDVINLLKKDIE